jgi:hypothetical protein
MAAYDRKEDKHFERARKGREWDEDRIRRFSEDQQRKREWINFAEIAKWFLELGGFAKPEKAAALVERAYKMLADDLLAGVFEEGGRSQVLFTCPGVTLRDGKMTRQWLKDAIDKNLDGERGQFYLMHCWLPQKLFKRWCARHHLPKSPPRFQPRQESPPRVSPEGAERSPDPPMPAAMLLSQPDKGGRPPAADWEALKQVLAEEIRIHGYPNRKNPPGWRSTKDVADWAEQKLGKEAEDVSPRTIKDNVRKLLHELKSES